MRKQPVRHAPLETVEAFTVGTTRIAPWQPGAIVNLRGSTSGNGFAAAAKSVLGVTLVETPNTLARGEAMTLLWLGPDEWLLAADPGMVVPIAELRDALADEHTAVTAADSSYAGIELSGPEALAVLAHGTPLDLHPSVFGAGQCAQTRLAKASVTLWCHDVTPTVRCLVRRSMADYLWRWCEAIAMRMQ